MIDEALNGFGEVAVCGWPWHGLVKRADDFAPYLLTLPNGTTRPHPLPERPWLTYKVQVPGVAPVVRDAEQQAADTAAGREWRSDALLTGRFMQLYNKDIGGWIYCAPDGSRWRVAVDLLNQAATVRRFGMFGQPADFREAQVIWPSDQGQGSPSIDPLIARFERSPVDITPDGRKAIFMIYADDPVADNGVRVLPLGFLLCEVTGGVSTPITLTYSVLRTREQTLGETAYTDNTVIVRNAQGGIVSAVGTATRSLTNRVWAMWFDQAGQPQPCVINLVAEFEQNCPADLSSYLTRNRVLREFKFGAHTLALDFESVFQGVQAAQPNLWNTTAVGTLNDVQFYATSGTAEKVPAGVEPPSALTQTQRLLRRGVLSQVFVGDFHDHQLIGNNALGFYVVLTPSGATPTHRYIGAMTPAGVVAADQSFTAANTPGTNQYAMYGPRPFGAFNPCTAAIAYPEQFPVGWV